MMKKNSKVLALLALGMFTLGSCSSDDDGVEAPKISEITLNLEKLENLGSDFLYEGWIIVDGAPVSTGTFSVSDDGTLSKTSFSMEEETINKATKFVLTIEPNPDTDPAPAATKYLAGDFNNNTATVGTGTVAADGFNNVLGEFIVAAPTGTGAAEEEFSGLWFLNNSSGTAVQGLTLPTLEDGWKYEGWVVVDGVALSTGTFTSLNTADEGAPFSGDNDGPPFPGEDFLVNAPTGVTFPTDIRGKTTVISIEPSPDNSAAPFTLKPLAGAIPAILDGVVTINSNVTASFPSGTVTR